MEGWKKTYLRLFAANDAGVCFFYHFSHTVTTVPSVRVFLCKAKEGQVKCRKVFINTDAEVRSRTVDGERIASRTSTTTRASTI
jgi:hypothetical protein